MMPPSPVLTMGWYSVLNSPEHRTSQVSFEIGALVGQVQLTQIDNPMSGRPLSLRLVHRGIGVPQELFGEFVT